MSATDEENEVLAYGKDRTFNLDELWDLYEQICEAEDKDDEVELKRLLAMLPMHPEVAKGTKRVLGKMGVKMLKDYDLTQVEDKFGKEWLDA